MKMTVLYNKGLVHPKKMSFPYPHDILASVDKEDIFKNMVDVWTKTADTFFKVPSFVFRE